MTTSACRLCGAAVSDAVVCTGCGRRCELALGDVPALVADLEITLARQGVGEPRVGSRGTETPLPFDPRASTVLAHLTATLCSWVLLVSEERYDGLRPLPVDRVSAMAGWLLGGDPPEVEWLRKHEAATEAFNEILDAISNARRVVDRPADKVFVGICTARTSGVECTEPLYAKPLADEVRCKICGTTHTVEERRKVLRLAVDDVLARPYEIARAVVWLGQHVRQDQITRWVQAKRLMARGHQVIGEDAKPMYRIGDVIDLLAADTKPSAASA